MSWWTMCWVLEGIGAMVLLRHTLDTFGPELIDAYVLVS